MTSDSVDIAAFMDGRRMSPYQYMVIALCGLTMIADGFDTQAISYAAPLIAKEWGLSQATLGPIFSSGLVGLMVGYLILPPLSDRFGHRPLIILGAVFFGIFTWLTVYAHGLIELMALRFLAGIGLGGVAPSAVAMTCDFSPRRSRATFVLIIYCGFSLGFVIAGLLAAKLIPSFGWRALFHVGGLAPLALVVLLVPFLPESPDHLVSRKSSGEKVAAILRRIDRTLNLSLSATTSFTTAERETGGVVQRLFQQRRGLSTALLWLVFFINLAEFYALQSWLPTVLRGLNYSMDQVALTTSLTTIGGILIVFVVGPCMDRLGSYTTVCILYLAGAVVIVLTGLVLTMPIGVVMVATFLTGVCISGGQKSAIALAAIHYPAAIRSTGVGWALGMGRLGGIAGPLAVGALFSTGWTPQWIFCVAGVPMFIAAIAILLIARGRQQAVAMEQEQVAARVA
ncbi:MAG: MFS transporter [Xanthobacteraceae bacterium]|nr:MAG: MFS transporter [Xanthobacteraceae bacterium]